MGGKPKRRTWLLPTAITAVFLAMAATGFLMGNVPGITDAMLKQSLEHADSVQGRDAMKVKLPRIGSADSSPKAVPR